MSLVALMNDAHAAEGSESIFSGIQSCDAQVRGHLLRNPSLQGAARDAASKLRSEFPDSQIDVAMDIDPDDGKAAIAFHLKVKALTSQRRMEFYALVPSLVSSDLSDRFVFLVDRV